MDSYRLPRTATCEASEDRVPTTAGTWRRAGGRRRDKLRPAAPGRAVPGTVRAAPRLAGAR